MDELLRTKIYSALSGDDAKEDLISNGNHLADMVYKTDGTKG
ncbi:hypothetical protein [Paenibacillus terrae]|nr:hypothetical protein [Paenibacillus terrae]